jgi:DNA-binding GntR family transcriptional regulator
VTNGGRRASGCWRAIHRSLRDAIIGHRLAPGVKLPEDELATIYGVSRTVVRSALQALAYDRLICLEPNRGAFVAKPSPREAQEVFEVRGLIEPRVASLAASAAQAHHTAHLAAHLEREHMAVRAGHDGDAIRLSAAFHVAVAEIAGNAILTDYVRDLVSRSSLIIALYWRRRDTTCDSHAHHALSGAIGIGDVDGAGELMRCHLVDLFSGLELSVSERKNVSLSEILRSREAPKADSR